MIAVFIPLGPVPPDVVAREAPLDRPLCHPVRVVYNTEAAYLAPGFLHFDEWAIREARTRGDMVLGTICGIECRLVDSEMVVAT